LSRVGKFFVLGLLYLPHLACGSGLGRVIGLTQGACSLIFSCCGLWNIIRQ
jgi:hypothetical protein